MSDGWKRIGTGSVYQKIYTRAFQTKVGHVAKRPRSLFKKEWAALFDGIYIAAFSDRETTQLQVDQVAQNWLDS